MKHIITSLSLVMLAFIAGAQEQKIEPSGNIITKEVAVKPFESIKATGLYELILSQGNSESVKVEADDNLQSLFSISNEGNTLVIGMPGLKNKNIDFNDKNDRHSLRLKVYVTFKKLDALDVGLVGNVRSATPLKLDAFQIDCKNVGNVELQLTANKINVNNKGVGNLMLSGTATDAVVTNAGVGRFEGEALIVQTMDINNSGVGKANVNVQKDLKMKESFLGKVTNKGSAKTHKMDGVAI